MKKINLIEKTKFLNEAWSPKLIGELNGQYVKIAKFEGEFTRHKHDNEDELFYVISGEMEIHFDDKIEHLKTGEMIIVPKGIYHKPISEKGCYCMLFEPKSTLNTGDIENELTKENLDWI